MGRAITRHDFETIYSMIAPEVVRTFNESGASAPVIMLFALDTREDGKIVDANVISPEGLEAFAFMSVGEEFEGMTTLRDELTRPGSRVRRAMLDAGMTLPDIVVHVAEGWMTPVLAQAGGPRKKHERRECIVIEMQALAYSVAAMCPIDEDTRRATLVPLPDGPSFVGERLSMTLD